MQDRVKLFISQSILKSFNIFLRKIYKVFLQPFSIDEDKRRKERIITLVIFSVGIFLLYLGFAAIAAKINWGDEYSGINISLFSLFIVFFLLLYFLCRTGYYKVAGYLFVIIYFTLTVFASIKFGVSMPAGLLSYVFIITVASAVINTKFGIYTATLSIVSIITIGLIEYSNETVFSWRYEPIQINDLFQYSVFLILLAGISWLSNHEIKLSLKRARNSERLLQEERDNLEILVAQRTKELQAAERERISQLIRFAEFGKRSAGLFHDLLGPLSALSLTITGLRKNKTQEIEHSISNAIDATRHMRRFMETIRKQLTENSSDVSFSVKEAIEESINLLNYQIIKSHVSISISCADNIYIIGNPLKFTQIMTNLLSNAIESFNDRKDDAIIIIEVIQANNQLSLVVTDNGIGIPEDSLQLVFDAFYTTKSSGIGLGLTTVKDIVEKTFQGTIHIDTIVGKGTTCRINIPS